MKPNPEEKPEEHVFICSTPGCNQELVHRVELFNETCDSCLFPLEKDEEE